MSVKDLWQRTMNFATENSPTILTGFGVAGVIGTAYMAYKASPKAHDILAKYREDRELIMEGDREAKRAVLKETVKDLVPVLAPPIIMGATTCACIIGGNSINKKRLAVLSAAYSLADSHLKEYQNKLVDTLGEQKAQKVRDAIAKDHLDRSDQTLAQSVVITNGDVLCYDSYTGRFFASTAEKIGIARNELSADCLTDMYVSLNDFYDKVGLGRVVIGDDIGWNIDDCESGILPISYSAMLTQDNRPCLVIEYSVQTREDFRRLH